MKDRPQIEWGPIDAKDEDDIPFFNKFVENSSLKELLATYRPLISGEKGSGKSAFRRYLVEQHRKADQPVKEISFDDMEFSGIVQNLNYLIEYTTQQPLSILSQYWQFTLFITAMRACMDKQATHLTTEETIIQEYLQDSGFSEMGVVSMMYTLTVNAIKKIEHATDPSDKRDFDRLKLPTSLSPQVYETIKKYPLFDPAFIKAKNAFAKYLDKGTIKPLVTLDDFDNIKAKSSMVREKIQTVFDALISAVYTISTSKSFRNSLLIYCFIPHDRFVAADLRDYDKIDYKHKSIVWDYESIKMLVERRIQVSIGDNVIFDDVWPKLFPAEIKNECYQFKENSFDYLLRHTQYRPRQLLRTLEALELKARAGQLDADGFSSTIHSMAKKNVEAFIKEYTIDHPSLKKFCARFKNFPNVVEYSDFRQLVDKAIADYGSYVSTDEKVDQLYNIGFFGTIKILREHEYREYSKKHYIPPALKDGTKYVCEYYYHKPEESISNSMKGDELVAVHPMFFDFCEQAAHHLYLVG